MGISHNMGNSIDHIRNLRTQKLGSHLPFDTKSTTPHHNSACIAVEVVNEKLDGVTHFVGIRAQPYQIHVDV